MNNKKPFEGVPVIFSYTRAQAIHDGVLIDLTEWARETGFTIPVACTAAVWGQYLYNAIRGSTGGNELLFKVIFLQAAGRHEQVTLKSHCGPGDRGEPVLTITLPGED